jgi:hypothetical protein
MPKITEAGEYLATVTSADFGESEKGSPYLTLAFATEDGAHIRAFLYLTEKAFPYTLKALKEAFGFDGAFEKDGKDNVAPQVVGRQARITVELEEYEGEERAKVKFINNVNGGFQAKPVANLQSFLKGLSDKARKIPGPAPSKPAPSASKPAPRPTPKAPKNEEGEPF